MKPIRVAQIGILHEHAHGKMDSLRKLPEFFEVVGYVDDRDFSVTPHYQTDLERPYAGLKRLMPEEVFTDPTLEAVAVEVPNNELVPMGLRCVERGLAIHLDKPAGEELAPYKTLLDQCAARHLSFQMGYMFRGNPAFQFAIRAIREHILGEVCEMEIDMNHNYGGEVYQNYLGNFRGGILWNLGCHLIDFVVAAMGHPSGVTPFLQSAPGDPAAIRNNCMAVLEYPHATVTLRACSRCGVPSRRMRVVGTRGSLVLEPIERFDGQPLEVILQLAESAGDFSAGTHVVRFPVQTDRYATQLIEWARCIRGETTSPYSFEHDLAVHAITLASSGLPTGLSSTQG
ncbi:MAG: Gfo/Idh/MocA family oxidoreductase [Victivallales bacterium]|nr:Gfo/Idh/MocA family oxidoreductase [Victivallales bacterium]